MFRIARHLCFCWFYIGFTVDLWKLNINILDGHLTYWFCWLPSVCLCLFAKKLFHDFHVLKWSETLLFSLSLSLKSKRRQLRFDVLEARFWMYDFGGSPRTKIMKGHDRFWILLAQTMMVFWRGDNLCFCWFYIGFTQVLQKLILLHFEMSPELLIFTNFWVCDFCLFSEGLLIICRFWGGLKQCFFWFPLELWSKSRQSRVEVLEARFCTLARDRNHKMSWCPFLFIFLCNINYFSALEGSTSVLCFIWYWFYHFFLKTKTKIVILGGHQTYWFGWFSRVCMTFAFLSNGF